MIKAVQSKSLLKRDLKGSELGLSTREELNIFYILIDKFISPLVKIEKIQAVPLSKRIVDSKNKKQAYIAFKTAMDVNSPGNLSEYLKQFVAVYGTQFKILKDFKETYLILKNKSLSQEEICRQIKKQNIGLEAVNDMISNFAEKPFDNIKLLAEAVLKIVFLKKLISESKIATKFGNKKLIDLVMEEI